uniref:Exopolygalacturonase n=1 Tax=Ananas comosus var. bracteatus TaxID=296719 RepID=A0A6V7PKM7_ANACO|nr:unnamed protein product [Ananas comosus var. bracteatus]
MPVFSDACQQAAVADLRRRLDGIALRCGCLLRLCDVVRPPNPTMTTACPAPTTMGCGYNNIFAVCSLLLLALAANSQDSSLQFNVKDFGAVADGVTDSTQAFQAAWNAACAAEGKPGLAIPEGAYAVGPLMFKGPCKGFMVVQLRGQLLASTDLNAYSKNWIEFQYITGLLVSGGGRLDGQGASAWPHNQCPKQSHCRLLPMSLVFSFVTDATVSGISSVDSKFFHMNIFSSSNFALDSIKISAPGDSPNTDGIHIGDSTDVRITNSVIGTGTTACRSARERQRDHLRRVLRPGHGISVGSLGKYPGEKDVVGLTVRNCTLTGTTNGLRIKTWQSAPSPSSASDFHFEDIVMNNVYNPIIIDQKYCPFSACSQTTPSQVKIDRVTFRNIRGTSASRRRSRWSAATPSRAKESSSATSVWTTMAAEMEMIKKRKFCSLLLLALAANSQDSSLQFNVKDFGAVADGVTDSTQAFQAAWNAACAAEGKPGLAIPEDAYAVGPLMFKGPCKGFMVVQLRGQLLASTDLNAYSKNWIEFQYITGLLVSGGGRLDGQGASAWPHNQCPKQSHCRLLPMSLVFSFVTDATVSGISSVDSKFFHMNIFSDDCVSVGPGSVNVTISDVFCGPGHGISVGSLGKYPGEKDVVGLTVRNCTLTGTTNGLRIKTWQSAPSPSSASDFHFEDIVMNNVYNPIIIDQKYCPFSACSQTAPSQVKIDRVIFRNIRGTSASPEAIKMVCSDARPCEGVELSDISLDYNGSRDGHDQEEKVSTTTCVNVRGTSNGNVKPASCI